MGLRGLLQSGNSLELHWKWCYAFEVVLCHLVLYIAMRLCLNEGIGFPATQWPNVELALFVGIKK